MKHRKPNRLKNYDYSRDGFYFVTICTHNRKHYFGEIYNRRMQLNRYGKIVQKQWLWLAEQYPYVEHDEHVFMPNHVHGIVIINRSAVANVGNGRDRSLPKIKPLSELIGAFKTTSSKLIHRAGLVEFRWQKSFYDHIIRNDRSLFHIRKYIQNNPLQWEYDQENLNNIPIEEKKKFWRDYFRRQL